jgi:hypothetical protein
MIATKVLNLLLIDVTLRAADSREVEHLFLLSMCICNTVIPSITHNEGLPRGFSRGASDRH